MTMMTIIIIVYTGRCTHILVAGDSIVRSLLKYAVIFVGVQHLTNHHARQRYRLFLTEGNKIKQKKKSGLHN